MYTLHPWQIGAMYPAPNVIYTFWEGFAPMDKMRVARLYQTHITSLKVGNSPSQPPQTLPRPHPTT